MDVPDEGRRQEERRLTHVDERGAPRMVDVGSKDVTRRTARAGARVWMSAETIRLLREQALPKGDALGVARIAGIMAAKKTGNVVPLCHPLPLDHVDVDISVDDEQSLVDIECVAATSSRTGVEMEALHGAAVTALTVYDMCKAVDKEMVIGEVRLLEKKGGKQDYLRPEAAAESSVKGRVVSVNVSGSKGERKKPVEEVTLLEETGIEGDGHAGFQHRQVSLLAQESIAKMVEKGLDVGPGDFAENVTTEGIRLLDLPVGTRLQAGEVLLEISQIGKVCHDRCAIYYQAGDCVMPSEGVFARVITGGHLKPGDVLERGEE